MTYISRSSEFALYFEDFLMYERHAPGLWVSMTQFLPQNKCRSLWSIFHGPVILPYTLNTIWCKNIILWDHESVWHDVWPQNKCRLLWPIFHSPVVLPYIVKTLWCMNIMLRDYESVWPIFFYLKINVSHCDLHFVVQWFCLVSWKLFDVWTSYFGIMSQYDTTFDLIINIGHCDLCFMVQWFFLIPWRLFDVWTSYFGIMSQYDMTFNLKIFVGHCDLYFIVHWIYVIFWRLFDVWTLYFVIISQCSAGFALKQSTFWSTFSWSSEFALYLK